MRAWHDGDGGRAKARHYPGLLSAWSQRMNAIRWNRVRQAKGLPLRPVPTVPLVMTPRAVEMRERRELARRQAAYLGIPYRDSMASDPARRRPRQRVY